MELRPETLTGRLVRLEPVEERHVEGLFEAGNHPEIWEHMPVRVDRPDVIRALIERARGWLEDGTGLGFAIRALSSDELVGGTSYLNADRANRRVEIGFTWLTPPWQRTGVNTECKYLLMRHAFESLAAVRVEFKTDSRNTRSRTAILRIGAVEEGTLRNHMIRPDGTMRHSVYFGVTREDWPSVKRRLEELMNGVDSGTPH